MLLSFPEYLHFNDLSQKFRTAFSFINLFLSVPVIAYSASGYFISAWKGLKNKFVNIDVPIAIGITLLFSRSVYEVFFSEGAGYFDSLAGLVFFLLIGKWYQNQSYEALSFDRDYRSYFPVHAHVKRNKQFVYEPIENLKEGDIISVKNNEVIACDAVLLSEQTQIDYSFITGESTPVEKRKGDLIYAGGRQLGPNVELKVHKPVSQSYLTQLWNEYENNQSNARIETILDKISKYFTITILVIAFLSGALWTIAGNFSTALLVATSVLIIACPCALALTVPFTYGHTTKYFGHKGLYLKNIHVAENLAQADTIVFDKTGTLTENNQYEIHFEGKELSSFHSSVIFSVVRHSAHPL
ncbi:MAG: hypothetical protein D6707_03960, partial [Bacteroidetes bacterium]